MTHTHSAKSSLAQSLPALLLPVLLLLAVTGCQSTATSTIGYFDRPLYLGATAFSLEKLENGQAQRRKLNKDGLRSLSFGENLQFQVRWLGRQNFLIQRRSHSFRNSAFVRLFRPITSTDSWSYQEDGLTIRWQDCKNRIALDERSPGKATIWHLADGRVKLAVDGSIEVYGSANPQTRRFQLPCELTLDRQGQLIQGKLIP